jgi:surfactin synthase thioesterase subunit
MDGDFDMLELNAVVPGAVARPQSAKSPWIGAQTQAPQARLKLIAFHHAGGNAGFFQPWVKYFQGLDWVEFVAIQLPGRGRRLSEPPLHDLPALLQAVEQGVAPLLDRPYVLFGFSMGAIMAFELALRRQQQGLRAPSALILAARGVPRTAALTRGAFSREKIVRELQRLGGTDPALIEDGPFMDVFMGTFQADFAVVDAHFCARPQLLQCPLHVWGGADDPEVSIERIYRWDTFAGRSFAGRLFPGDHFFLKTAQAAVFDNLLRILDTVRRSP